MRDRVSSEVIGLVHAYPPDKKLGNALQRGVSLVTGGLLEAGIWDRAVIPCGLVGSDHLGRQMAGHLYSAFPQIDRSKIVVLSSAKEATDTPSEQVAFASYLKRLPEDPARRADVLFIDTHINRVVGNGVSALATKFSNVKDIKYMTVSEAQEIIDSETRTLADTYLTSEVLEDRRRYDERTEAWEAVVGPKGMSVLSNAVSRFGLKGFAEGVIRARWSIG